GYESRTHMDAAMMVDRVLQRANDHTERVVSDTAESIAHQRIKRVKWLREWLEEEVSRMDADSASNR
ncbi:MAG: HD domain-containing protein, partial [Halobacteriota archaeon]